jgi:hypothetical protein
VLAVDASIADRVVQFVADALNFSPIVIGPVSAFRSTATQWWMRELWGGRAAPPGTSDHEAGFALDINNFSSMSAGVQLGVLGSAAISAFVRNVPGEPHHFFAGSYGPFGSRQAAIDYNQGRLAAQGGVVRNLPLCR